MDKVKSRFVRIISPGQDSTSLDCELIELVGHVVASTMNVEVRSFGGLSGTLVIDTYTTISDVKHDIARHMYIPTVEQRPVVGKKHR